MTPNLLDYDLPGLTRYFAELGEKPFRAKQVMRWMHHFGAADFDAMSDLAKSLREKLKQVAIITPPSMMTEQASSDGTRGTWCVSSQVGCALECTFCSTGRQGFNRNLSVAEIIGQLWYANHALGRDPKGERVISNVVMMGKA